MLLIHNSQCTVHNWKDSEELRTKSEELLRLGFGEKREDPSIVTLILPFSGWQLAVIILTFAMHNLIQFTMHNAQFTIGKIVKS